MTDGLTGLHDARGLANEAGRLVDEVADGETCWVVLVDVDRLKARNDEHGHLAGDEAIAAVARVVCGALPEGAFVARAGGDEVAALLRHVGMTDARAAAEAARSAVAAARPGGLTVSVGVAGWLPAAETFEQAMSRAELACHSAKSGGRNAVHVFGVD